MRLPFLARLGRALQGVEHRPRCCKIAVALTCTR